MVIHKTKTGATNVERKKEDVQSPKNVFLYSWLECEAGRGSNEICSALMNFLELMEQRCKLRKYKKLHLFCDSCPGQNKNSTMLSMLLTYVNSKECPFTSITVFFPVVGHSYLPADRVYGRIEKDIRKCNEIITPTGYHNILKNHGQLKLYQSDWLRYDYKSLAQSLINMVGCKTRDSRRWNFVKNSKSVWLSDSFTEGYTKYNVLKKNVTNLDGRKPKLLPPETEKKKDVLALLKLVKGTKQEKKIYDTLLKETLKKK